MHVDVIFVSCSDVCWWSISATVVSHQWKLQPATAIMCACAHGVFAISERATHWVTVEAHSLARIPCMASMQYLVYTWILSMSVSEWLHVFLAAVGRNSYLLYHDVDTKKGSSGSPVVVAESLQKPDGPQNGLAVIALHTAAANRQSNIATLLTPLIDML